MDQSKDLRQHRCCFTGHRAAKLSLPEDEVSRSLKKEIMLAAAEGWTTFITGMADGTDLIAAEYVLTLKERCAEIRLIAAVPYQGFEKPMEEKWKQRYLNVLSSADHVHYIRPSYSSHVFQLRNEWMVDHSSRVIAVYNGTAGGTKNTIRYALGRHIPIVILPG